MPLTSMAIPSGVKVGPEEKEGKEEEGEEGGEEEEAILSY